MLCAGSLPALHRRPAGPAVAMLRCLGPPPAPSGPGPHPLPSPVGEWVGFRHLDPVHRVTARTLSEVWWCACARTQRGSASSSKRAESANTTTAVGSHHTAGCSSRGDSQSVHSNSDDTRHIGTLEKEGREGEEGEGEEGEAGGEGGRGGKHCVWHHIAQPSD